MLIKISHGVDNLKNRIDDEVWLGELDIVPTLFGHDELSIRLQHSNFFLLRQTDGFQRLAGILLRPFPGLAMCDHDERDGLQWR